MIIFSIENTFNIYLFKHHTENITYNFGPYVLLGLMKYEKLQIVDLMMVIASITSHSCTENLWNGS